MAHAAKLIPEPEGSDHGLLVPRDHPVVVPLPLRFIALHGPRLQGCMGH